VTEANELAGKADFRVGQTHVRPSVRKICGSSGNATVEPRVMQVLIALHDAGGAVLSRDDLLEQCWGGVVVGDDAINRTIAEIRRVAKDTDAEIQIETIPRVGYRFLLPGGDARAGTGVLSEINRRAVIISGVAGVASLAGIGAGFTLWNKKDDLDELIDQAVLLQASGSPEATQRSAEMFKSAIARDPRRADAWGWLSQVLGDHEKAREAALRAIEIDPGEPNARIFLIAERWSLDSWTEWESEMLGVLEDAPENPKALTHLTLFYQGLGLCQQSWNTNERAIRIEPRNPTHVHRLALKHWIFGRIGEADKVADQALSIWPEDPFVWNSRITIYAFTDRGAAGLALLDDIPRRPANLTQRSIASWRAGLNAIAERTPSRIAEAIEICSQSAQYAPGLAANAIMIFSHLGEVDAAYSVAEGLFEGRGSIIQRVRGKGINDVYSHPGWGRTQFVFTPAAKAFRDDPRFTAFCERLGHVKYWRTRLTWPDAFVRGSLEIT
jgi:tetratricopeptide (TPR) repeat protein